MSQSQGVVKLNVLERSIATLDHQQSKAVMETVGGVQRIRGLAGSGKTIVLAQKAAYLHAQNPSWKIGVTFKTRSLKDFFRRLIRDFHIDMTNEEPQWEYLRIVNSWGAPGNSARDGIYYEYCRENGVDYLDFETARAAFGQADAFDGACKTALESSSFKKEVYEALLIDEAQDLPPTFLAMCYELLKEPKRLVYAYDELQNLSGESLPPPEEIFGKHEDGRPIVSFDNADSKKPTADIILKKCYRNPGPVLVTAHAIGFGVYRTLPQDSSTGLVQMFDHPHLWKAVGYEVQEGELRDGRDVVLGRTDDTSPSHLAAHSPLEDLIDFRNFETREEQAQWIAESIEKNLVDDELRHNDIMVINPNPITTRMNMGPIRAILMDKKIRSHLAGVDTSPDVFEREDSESITFTGIYRAKGNEAAMVYIINAESGLSSTFNLARIRNRLFTAITRSKAWIRVTGVGKDMKILEQEYRRLKGQQFKLQFRYPTAKDREHLRTIHREMSSGELRRLSLTNRSLEDTVRDIEEGKLVMEDLDPKLVDSLMRFFRSKSE